MTFTVTQSIGRGDAFLLVDAGDGKPRTFLYDRSAQVVTEIDKPARLVGRASWRDFDGDPAPIVREAKRLLGADQL